MQKTKTDNRSRFERQRRKLLISSTVMIAYVLLGLEINTINFLGNQFSIQNVRSAELCLWVLFTYFLIRYIQFFAVVENKEFIPIYHESMQKYVQKLAIKVHRDKVLPSIKSKNPGASNFLHTVRKFEIIKKYPNQWEMNIEAAMSFQYENGSQCISSGPMPITISGNQLYLPKMKSILNVGLLTPHLTEYFLPFFLAIFAIVFRAWA